MIFEPADSSLPIAKLIVENARYLTANVKSNLVSKSEKKGYINLIEGLLATSNAFYQEMKLNDDFRFQAVADKATSFVRIADSVLKNNEASVDDLERMQAALSWLEDSFTSMKSYWLYSESTDAPDF